MKKQKTDVTDNKLGMLQSWTFCSQAHDKSGMKLFAGILLEKHNLNVRSSKQIDAFLKEIAKEKLSEIRSKKMKPPKHFCLDKRDWESNMHFFDKEEKSHLNCFGVDLEHFCKICRRDFPKTHEACRKRDEALNCREDGQK